MGIQALHEFTFFKLEVDGKQVNISTKDHKKPQFLIWKTVDRKELK